jgi:NAD(P)-dependent dehydrogenase (short-subunit alcohol dehydrogenase family)
MIRSGQKIAIITGGSQGIGAGLVAGYSAAPFTLSQRRTSPA